MRAEPVVVIVGSRSIRDYVGSRSLYLFKALDEAGIRARVVDWKSRSPDPIPGTSHLFFLPWCQYIDSDVAAWCRSLCPTGTRVAWTEEARWWSECRARAKGSWGDPEEAFNVVAFSTPEGAWSIDKGPAERAVWPPLVHSRIGALAREETDGSAFFDSAWPDEWCSGVWNSRDLTSDLAEELASRGARVVVGEPGEGLSPLERASRVVSRGSDLESEFLPALAPASCFVVTHHESLGMVVAESQTLGVPVVAAEEHVCSSVREGGGVYTWRAGKAEESSEEPRFDETASGPGPGSFSDPNTEPRELLRAAFAAASRAGSDAEERKRLSKRASAAFGEERFFAEALRPLGFPV